MTQNLTNVSLDVFLVIMVVHCKVDYLCYEKLQLRLVNSFCFKMIVVELALYRNSL